MDARDFFGPEGKIAQLPQSTRKAAIISLVNILQSGIIEQRRHDVIMGLQGKIEITKLSFGLTTSALTRQTGKRKFS